MKMVVFWTGSTFLGNMILIWANNLDYPNSEKNLSGLLLVVKENNKHLYWEWKRNTGQCCPKVRDHNKKIYIFIWE